MLAIPDFFLSLLLSIMELSPEQKINMSLEDLIAAKNQSTKQKRESKQPANNEKKKSGGLVISKPRNLAGRANNTPTRRSTRIRPNTANSNNSNAATSVNSTKVAKSVGTTRANRNAAVNQRRGLNNTGKATKAEVNKEVNKQLTQRTGGGLKISFKPAELQKTTDRTVAQQIRAVLSRHNKANNNNNSTNGSNSTGRSIASRTSSNSGNTRRSNPKVRGKNTILKVNH